MSWWLSIVSIDTGCMVSEYAGRCSLAHISLPSAEIVQWLLWVRFFCFWKYIDEQNSVGAYSNSDSGEKMIIGVLSD